MNNEYIMRRGKSRDYEEFTILKDQAFEKITQQNAEKMFHNAKNQIMNKLNKLDANHITEVEDLYLIVAQLTQAATYIAAIKKADSKGISFDAGIRSIGVDDVSPILLDAFKDHPKALDLHKINLIDHIYKPAKQAWSALHARMELVANGTKAYHVLNALQDIVPTYKNHLENKLREDGVTIPLPKEMPKETSTLIKKRIIRYEAVLALENRIQGKKSFNLNDIKFAEEQIKKCLDNKPDWSERSFLQKLTDILTLGIKPLFRAFFSKEKEFQQSLEHLPKVKP